LRIELAKLKRPMNDQTALDREFPKRQLTEIAETDFESRAKESFQIAIEITYQNGTLVGTPMGEYPNYRGVVDAKVVPNGYARVAMRIADRRMMLAGFRLADLLKRLQ